jgi:hypothetical protein
MSKPGADPASAVGNALLWNTVNSAIPTPCCPATTEGRVWVKDGRAGRSTGTSPVPQIPDDFVHRASRQRWAISGHGPGRRWPGYLLVVAKVGNRCVLPRSQQRSTKSRSAASLRSSRPDQPSISILPDRMNSKKPSPWSASGSLLKRNTSDGVRPIAPTAALL